MLFSGFFFSNSYPNRDEVLIFTFSFPKSGIVKRHEGALTLVLSPPLLLEALTVFFRLLEWLHACKERQRGRSLFAGEPRHRRGSQPNGRRMQRNDIGRGNIFSYY